MSSIPLMVNPPAAPQGPMQQAQSATSLQSLINQTRLQRQAEQQNQLTLQQQQIATQEAQQQQKDTQIFNQAFKDAKGDWGQAIQNATDAGASGQFITKAQMARNQMLTNAAALSKDQLANEATKSEELAQSAQKVIDAPEDQRATVYAQERNRHLASGAWSANDIPEQMPAEEDLENIALHNKANQDLIAEALKNKQSQEAAPAVAAAETVKQTQSVAQLLANAPGDATYQSILKNARQSGVPDTVLSQFADHWSPEAVKQAAQASLSPEERAKLPVENLEMASYLSAHPDKTPADYAQWKAGLNAQAQISAAQALMGHVPPAPGTPGGAGGPALTPSQIAGQKIGFTPTALDQAAERFAQTAQLPAGARGGALGIAQNRAIMNRAAELYPQGSLAQNSAEYKANEASLASLQKNFDQVTAFENTALKNLDQVADAGREVPDLNTRFATIPVRLINAKMLGTPQMARFRTALLTAQTEAAKVLSSANASGVLSDSARHEAQEVLDGNLPFRAMMTSINQLKTDFGNREQSYRDQIAAIQGRLGPKNQQQQSSAHKIGDVITQKGHNFKVTAVDANGKVTGATAQ